MNTTPVRSPARLGRRAASLALVLVILAVTACGTGKTPAQRAQEELNAGLAADAAGNQAEAAVHYKACLTFETTNKFCIFDLGVLAQNAGRALEAENAYRLALLQDLDFAPALYNLAILRATAGSTAEAIALYRHLIEVDPNNAGGHFNLGLALVSIGEVEAGKKEIAEGIRLNPALVAPSPGPTPTTAPTPTLAPSPEPSPSPS
jgi:tetratricopeptide (TPR) repeat protein